MKNILLPLILVIFVSTNAVFAQSEPALSLDELNSVLEFDTSLKSIYENINAGVEIPTDRYYLLTGAVTSITIYETDPALYETHMGFMSAEWNGTSDISTYDALLVFIDPAFAPRFPERTPRDPGPEVILNNSRGMVLCTFYSLFEDFDGKIVPIFIAHDYKSLD